MPEVALTADRVSQVSEELEKNDRGADELSAIIQTLSERLNPVLREPDAKNEAAGLDAPDPPMCPLAYRLYNHGKALKACRAHVDNILSLLEV